MGIYDRDYYREESRGFFGGGSSRTRVCTTLIIINIVVFLIQLMTRERMWRGWDAGWFTEALWLNAEAVTHGQVWRLITHAFLHSTTDPLHIIFNMLFLWWFGSAMEDIYGSKEFLAFYLTAALLAGLGYIFCILIELTPNANALGASGAVTAALVLFAMHYPHHTILLFFILPIPVWALVVFNVIQDTVGLFGGGDRPIAFAAHLTGAVFGFFYFRYQWRVLNWLPSFSRSRSERRRPRLRVVRSEPVTSPPGDEGASTDSGEMGASVDRGVDEHLEAKLDAVLEKVAKHGQDSLNEEEREILFRASEIYKRRRH